MRNVNVQKFAIPKTYTRKEKDCILISIDESLTSTGVAVFINGTLKYYGNIKPKTKETQAEIPGGYHLCLEGQGKKAEISRDLLAILHKFKPDILIMEDVYQGKCINGFKGNVFLQGVCFGYALMNGCDYFTYFPSEWRKLLGINEVGAKRSILKELDKQYIYNKYGLTVNDDIADAICIGLAHIQYVDELIT